MNLIQTTSIERNPSAVIAEQILSSVNAQIAERVVYHKKQFRRFWDSPQTPDSILAAMGTNAALMLAAANENLEHIGRLAALIGCSLDDFIAPGDYQPRRGFVISQDGTATLTPPAEGFDEWGFPISEPVE